jgi:cyclopropane-fatty-acyl-phospholipid synthase
MQEKHSPRAVRTPRAVMLNSVLRRLIRRGRLTVIYADGSRHSFGKQDRDEPDIVVRLTTQTAPWLIALHPDRYLGEAYMDGQLLVEQGDLWGLLDLCGRNIKMVTAASQRAWFRAAKTIMRRVQQYNPAGVSRANVAHHYDLSPDLYRTFLDDDMQYSCAYFRSQGATLEEAQREKKFHIASKLLLEPGQTVLDIGCGWGGLALTLARVERVKVLGITLSAEQLQIARQRALESNLQDRVTFELCDYRAVEGKFDRIVSVGMFEHVGTPHYATFFKQVSNLLKSDGIALLHSIGRMHGPDVTSSWIRKYIFPGGYIPAISEVMPAIEGAGLWLTDLEILRLHYAKTLRLWRQRFLAHAEWLEPTYDDRFKRMWEYYLAVSEMSFLYGGMMVFQAQLTNSVSGLPITRDYMVGRETQLTSPIAAE